jgi:hypothetical protein
MENNIFALQLLAEGEGAATGVTAADAAPQSTPQTGDAGDFDALIQGQFKEQYQEKVRDILQKRLKSSKETVDKYNALAPTLTLLAQKYGVAEGDAEALHRAVEREVGAEGQRTAGADRLHELWVSQAQAAKESYPGFDFSAELKNPQFRQLLRSRVDVKTAYEITHKEELIPAAMAYTARTLEEKLAKKFMAGGGRPLENGMSGQGAALTRPDVSAMTRAGRREIIRRVQRGETIRF